MGDRNLFYFSLKDLFHGFWNCVCLMVEIFMVSNFTMQEIIWDAFDTCRFLVKNSKKIYSSWSSLESQDDSLLL